MSKNPEVALIEKVELRLALANTDEKFESSLKIYLTPLLLKLASPLQDVKKQVLNAINYIITRFNSSKNLKLPIDSLLNQLKDEKLNSMENSINVQLYTLVFISKGISRLNTEESIDLLPKLINNFSNYNKKIQARLFNIILKLLNSFKYSKDRNTKDGLSSFRNYLNFNESQSDIDSNKDEIYLLDLFIKFLLLQPILPIDNKIPTDVSQPGLSTIDTAFFTYDAGVSFDSHTLSTYKLNILKFTEFGFNLNRSILLFLIGSCDANSSISDFASTVYKRFVIDYENDYLVNYLITLFEGDPMSNVLPTKLQLQEKIINFLSQSKKAALSPNVSSITLIGLNSDYAKLKQATVKFVKWATTIMTANDEDDFSVSSSSSSSSFETNKKIAEQLRSNLLNSPMENSNGSSYASFILQRRYQFEALGLILRRTKDLVDTSYIKFLFNSLITESPDLKTTIQESLSGITIHLIDLSIEEKIELKSFLKDMLKESFKSIKSHNLYNNVKNVESYHTCCLLSIKFINYCFPFDDSEARIFNLQCQSAFNKPDTFEQASRGLNPYWFGLDQSTNDRNYKSLSKSNEDASKIKFPSFNRMTETLNSNLKDNIDINVKSSIEFIMQCLVMESISGHETVVIIDREFETRLEKGLEYDEKIRNCLISFLNVNEITVEDEEAKNSEPMELDDMEDIQISNNESTLNKTESITLFLTMLKDILISKDSKDDLKNYVSKLYLKIISLSSNKILLNLSSNISEFIELLSNKSVMISNEIAVNISNILGILIATGDYPDESIMELFKLLTKPKEESTVELNVSILTLGFIISRLSYCERKNLITSDVIEYLLNEIASGIGSTSSSSLLNSSMVSLSQLCMFNVLNSSLVASIDEYKSKFIELLKPLVTKNNERAIHCLSYIYINLDNKQDPESCKLIETIIYDSHVTKQQDLLFSSGESLTVIAYGWNSKFMLTKIDIQNKTFEKNLKSKFLKEDKISEILNMILKSSQNTKPSLRKASCIWLLSIVQYCGDSQEIISKAPEMNFAFMRFLAERDELIQESASRGLSIVYEMGDNELKDTLVHNLLLSFTDNNSAKSLISGSIGEETQLFEPGVLNTNDGSISTYKDILNLASEVGDPGLVYKFMSLAHHSALWSSKKGIAFGLGAVFAKSKLDSLLVGNEKFATRLIPKLFRYRFDPSLSVQKSMNEIWNSLISDPSAVVVANFDIILKELLTGMGNREWRVRQASTSGLADLLRYVPIEKYEPKIEEIWTMSFRVMDDIKDSVRKEGNALTKYLATTMVRTISSSETSVRSTERSKKVLSHLIPFLLGQNGLLSDAEDIRSFAFQIILNLCKESSIALKPYVSEMVEKLTVLMSTIEPQVINYLTLNADKYNLKAEDIDERRLQSVGSSPLLEAIERLLGLLDESLMEEFIQSLKSAIKASVGLPSKVTGSKIIVTLVVKHIFISKPYGDQLLKIASSQLKDRNETIAASYAAACGYCCRIASISKISSFGKKLVKLYFESDDVKIKKISGIASESVCKNSGDVFNSVESGFLPLAFIAKHDFDSNVSKFFEKEWDDSTGGSGAIKLYIQEIIALISDHIKSQDFQVRQVCAKSIVEVSNKINGAQGLGPIADSLFEILLESCKGRSWKGKEEILESLVSLSVNSKIFIFKNSKDHELIDKISKTILVEAKRNNIEYKKKSIKSLGKFINSFHHENENLVDEYIEIMKTFVTDEYFEDSDQDSDLEMVNIDDQVKNNKKFKVDNRKNQIREEERIQFIKNVSSTFYVFEDGEIIKNLYSNELFKFLNDCIIGLFNTVYIKNSWKSKILIGDCIIEVINKFNFSNDDKVVIHLDNLQKLEHVYKLMRSECNDQDALQNVLISYIRAMKKLKQFLRFSAATPGEDSAEFQRKADQLTETIDQDLAELKSSASSSILLKEIDR
ncbi:hypothetical protein B5S31_g5042 [[Candida] boidinii]|nr:hypothetical protein B5S31_g5042 [[Candida] boidinii]